MCVRVRVCVCVCVCGGGTCTFVVCLLSAIWSSFVSQDTVVCVALQTLDIWSIVTGQLAVVYYITDIRYLE